MHLLMGRFGGGAAVGMPVLALAISADQDSGFDISSTVGTLAVATRLVVSLNPSFRIKQLITGAFPAGSQMLLINKGAIYGPGGAGGTPGVNGSNGGHAIVLSTSSGLVLFEIDNGAGYIYAGGGGGKGTNGVGGGGGAGAGAGGNGGGGFTNGRDGKPPKWLGASWGDLSNAGGRGGLNTLTTLYGNSGCDWATTGLTGDGAPGKAIALNGGVTPTWIAGNTSDRVKGAVS